MIVEPISLSSKNLARGFDHLIDIDISGDNIFNCTNIDPQCQVVFNSPLAPGWYLFEFKYKIIQGKIINPKCYLDSGQGYNEVETVFFPKHNQGKVKRIVHLPDPVYKVRFDPSERTPSKFQLNDFLIRRLSGVSLYREIGPTRERVGMRGKLTTALSILSNNVKAIDALLAYSVVDPDPFQYQDWIDKYDTHDEAQLNSFRLNQKAFDYRPLISIVVPAYNTKEAWLNECIQSVVDQVYDNWQLCIADDKSTDENVRTIIKDFANKHKGIVYTFRETNGHISKTSNSALALAKGEYVCLLDHDDRLTSLALYRIVESLNIDKETDFFYSDEDKIDANGNRSLPFFKPDWSPSLFYSQNYITHLACIRRSILMSVNGFTEEMDGSQDYDLFLKLIAAGARIKHLPFILYHWRLHDASTSMVSGAKPYAHTAGKKALEKYLASKYPLHYDRIDDGEHTFTYLPRFKFSAQNKISIIIPTKDNVTYLSPCISSILTKSTWQNYEILILDNNSVEQKTFDYFREIQSKHSQVSVIDAPMEFNWSKLNNLGARHATGNYLLFLNNDISVITPQWMEMLCEYASLPDVATVGASLLYEDNSLQHAGVVVGMGGWADHVFKGMQVSHFPSPFISNSIPRNVLAVTGACTAIERSKFEKLGQFDESFIICGSDVELGIRAYKNDLFNVVHSAVKLYHYESKTRGNHVPENDFIQSAAKYEPYRTQLTDPFFNPNLSLMHTSPTCKQ